MPDIAVLPEASAPRDPIPGLTWFGGPPIKGLAVLCADGFRVDAVPADPSVVWSIRLCRVVGPVSFDLLAVWTRRDPTYVGALDKALTVYRPLLGQAPLVVVGDFNANAIWDKPRRPTDFSRLARRLHGEFGLVSAYHGFTGERFGAESRATHYFWWQEERPFHIDYCFAPAGWPVVSVGVGTYGDWSDVSDHRPLVVEFSDSGIPSQ